MSSSIAVAPAASALGVAAPRAELDLTLDGAALDGVQWALLWAIAAERKVARSALVALYNNALATNSPSAAQSRGGGAHASPPAALGAWLGAWLAEGVLVDAGTVPSHSFARSLQPENAVQIAPGLRAQVLRRCGREGALGALVEGNRAVLGERSVAGFVTALYQGNVAALERALAGLRFQLPANEVPGFARRMLWEALCPAFDAAWLQDTWGPAALLLAEQALQDALLTLEPVAALVGWSLPRALSVARPELWRALCEHALLSGELQPVLEVRQRFATAEQLSWAAAANVVEGSFSQAQAHLDECLSWAGARSGNAVRAPSAVALLSLLAISREGEEAVVLAKRLVRTTPRSAPAISGWPAAGNFVAVGRGVRRLLQYRSLPESEVARLDAYQLPPETPAWEVLLLGHAAQGHVLAPITRRAWGERVQRDALRWHAAGYAWFARQGFELAAALLGGTETAGHSVTAEDRETENQPLAQPRTNPHSQPVNQDVNPTGSLGQLLPAPAQWRAPLAALAAFAASTRAVTTEARQRVAWFVDMAHGTLAKPSIESFTAEDGWTRGRRVNLHEVFAQRAALPAEDQLVLDRLASHSAAGLTNAKFAGDLASDGQAHEALLREALDALCGHPRVYNGARGRALVEVVRGRPRVETRREHGHWLLATQPAVLREGVQGVAESESRLVVYRVSATLAQLGGLLPQQLRVPEAHVDQLRQVLATLSDHVEIHDAEPGAPSSDRAASLPCVRISVEAGAWWIEIGVRPFGELGRFFPAGQGSRLVTRYVAGVALDVERDLEREQAQFTALVNSCPVLADAHAGAENERERDLTHAFVLGEEELFTFILQLRATEVPHHLEWKNSRPIGARGSVTRAALRCALRRTKGWYLVTGGVRIDAVTEIALAELARMPFTKTGRFVRLPTGDFVQIEERVRRVLSVLAATGQPGEHAAEWRFPDSAFETAELLTQADSGFEVEQAAQEWLQRVQAENARVYPVPETLTGTLRAYQEQGYQWLRRSTELGVGVCLADDMGLGKTLQVIALLLSRVGSGPVLVIAPTSVCTNWVEELRRFAPSLQVAEYWGSMREAALARCQPGAAQPLNVLIGSYALLQQDARELTAIAWDTVVLDEAQFIKNSASVRAKTAYRLRAQCRLALSGTPVENHLGELWSIFHFLNPNLLGTAKHFDTHFQKPVERDRDADRAATLRALVRPFLLRRTKSQVLRELPAVTELKHEVRLSHDEAVRYATLRKQIHEQLYDSSVKRQNKLQALAELTRLRRFCCHPRLVFPDAPLESSKVEAFLELVEELRHNGHRALVFSQFVDFLEIVRERLDERGFVYQYLHGGTPKAERTRQVEQFQTGAAELFLISLKAGGFGLNLTAADYVIHLDPWWNPASEAQATDRAHRIGQTRPVTVYRLITKDSIEERVVELHREKRALAEALLAGSSAQTQLTLADLQNLLRDSPEDTEPA